MSENGDMGSLMFQARVDLSKIESDIKELQKKFDLKPISLKLKIDDSSLREIVTKIQNAVNGALKGLGGASGMGHTSVSMLPTSGAVGGQNPLLGAGGGGSGGNFLLGAGAARLLGGSNVPNNVPNNAGALPQGNPISGFGRRMLPSATINDPSGVYRALINGSPATGVLGNAGASISEPLPDGYFAPEGTNAARRTTYPNAGGGGSGAVAGGRGLGGQSSMARFLGGVRHPFMNMRGTPSLGGRLGMAATVYAGVAGMNAYAAQVTAMAGNAAGDPRVDYNAIQSTNHTVNGLLGDVPSLVSDAIPNYISGIGNYFGANWGGAGGYLEGVNERTERRMGEGELANKNVRQGYAAITAHKFTAGKILGMSDDIGNQKAGVLADATAQHSQTADEYRDLRDEAGKIKDPAERKQRKNRLTKEQTIKDADIDKVAQASGARLQRGEDSRILGSGGRVKATNLSGVDDYSSGLASIQGQYSSALSATDSHSEWDRLYTENKANVGAYNRANRASNYSQSRQIDVGMAQNRSAGLALQGNNIGSSIAGIQAQRVAANAQMADSLVGVDKNTNAAKYYGIVGQNAVQNEALNIQDKQVRKDYGLQMNQMDTNNRQSQQTLGHDFIGAAMTGIAGQRAYAKATMGSGQFSRADQGFRIEERQATVNEQNRALTVGLDTESINSNAAALQMSAKGQEMHAQVQGVKGEYESRIKGVQALDITDKEKSDRIDALTSERSGKVAGIQREIRHRQYGGTATSMGNFVNFAQDATRDRDPQEDMNDARNTADAVNAAPTGVNAKAAIAGITAGNNAVGAVNAQASRGDAAKDSNDMAAGQGGQVVTLLAQIVKLLPQALAAQP